MSQFTAQEKAECAQREYRMRINVYPRLIAKGSMTSDEAETELAKMKEIAEEYRKQAAREFEQGSLFAHEESQCD